MSDKFYSLNFMNIGHPVLLMVFPHDFCLFVFVLAHHVINITWDLYFTSGTNSKSRRKMIVTVITTLKQTKRILSWLPSFAHRFEPNQLLTVINGILRLVRLLFSSVEHAFGSEHHHGSLDDLLSCLFSTLQPSAKGGYVDVKSPLVGYMDYLPLPDDVVVCGFFSLFCVDFLNLT